MCKLYLYILLIFLSFFSINSLYLLANDQKPRLLQEIKKIERNNKRVPFTGYIKIPNDFECSHFYVCYNGKLVKIKNESSASYIFKDFDANKIFMLFVSPENLISTTQEENNIYTFKLKRNSNYKLYTLTKNSNEVENNWNIEQSELKNNQLNIPLHTFIILLDPEAIDFSLKNVSWKKNSSVVELPKIIINKVLDNSKLTKSCLAFMDIKPFHVAQEKKEITKNKVKISMFL